MLSACSSQSLCASVSHFRVVARPPEARGNKTENTCVTCGSTTVHLMEPVSGKSAYIMVVIEPVVVKIYDIDISAKVTISSVAY